MGPSRTSQSAMSPFVTSHFEERDNCIDRFYSPMTKDMIPHVLVKDAINFHKDLGGLVSTRDLLFNQSLKVSMSRKCNKALKELYKSQIIIQINPLEKGPGPAYSMSLNSVCGLKDPC